MCFSLTSSHHQKYLHRIPYKSNICTIIDTIIHKYAVILLHVLAILLEVFNIEKYITFNLQSNSNYYDAQYTVIFNLFNHFCLCFNLQLHNYNINNHYCIFLCLIPPWGRLKKAETCVRITTCLCVIICNYSSDAGIYRVGEKSLYTQTIHTSDSI